MNITRHAPPVYAQHGFFTYDLRAFSVIALWLVQTYDERDAHAPEQLAGELYLVARHMRIPETVVRGAVEKIVCARLVSLDDARSECGRVPHTAPMVGRRVIAGIVAILHTAVYAI